ncbi:MAG: hypothetical protein AAGI28_04875 [Pseudomonadota bacterium]
MNKAALPVLAMLVVATPLSARESLGVYVNWAAFRDDAPSRCYAIAKPIRSSDAGTFASIATWPDRNLRGQLHIRLSRQVRDDAETELTVGERKFELITKGRNAWAKDNAMDTSIIAAMRSATRMSVAARANNGVRFTDRYNLAGAATAMDASIVGCATKG